MKKVLSFFLVFYIVSAGICFAADPKALETPIVISMDKIEQIWTEKSQDLLKYQSQLNLAYSTYNNLVDRTDNMTDAPLGSINMSIYNSLWNSRDQAELSYKIAQVQYKQNVQNAKNAAKKALLTCWQDEINIKLTQSNLTMKEGQLRSYEVLLSQGYLSRYQYNNMKSSVNSLKDNLGSLKLQQETDQVLLKSKLGLKTDDVITLSYPELNQDIFAKLMKMDCSADLVACQKNSANLNILQITCDIYNKQSAPYAQRQRATADLEVAQANLPDAFRMAYNSLMNQYIDLKSNYNKLEDEYDQCNKLNAQYRLGVCTFTDYSNAVLSYTSAETQTKNKEISLYSSYLTYLNMVAGYES